ncbi:hypothetical protein ABZ401_26055 [Streptomyces sp. NPDC005892]|uniref:hypothetical protein n=1 Tax=Streptomyces sp. NPDC005892 TaxID=3155593 RepID=UPI0033C9BBA9
MWKREESGSEHEGHLTALVAEQSLVALRAVAVLEHLAAGEATRAAPHIDPADAPWETVAQALGISGQTARARITRYAPRSRCTGEAAVSRADR